MSGEDRNGEDEQGTLESRKEIIWSGWERTWMWMHVRVWMQVRACECMGVCRRGRMEKQVAWRREKGSHQDRNRCCRLVCRVRFKGTHWELPTPTPSDCLCNEPCPGAMRRERWPPEPLCCTLRRI